MKIAFVTECYHPVCNGVVFVVDMTAKQLKKRGNEVIVIAPKHPKAVSDPEWVVRVPSLPNPFYPDYPAAIPWSRKLHRTLDEFQPDILHTHSFAWLSRLALKCAKRLDVPVVTTFHTLVTEYLHYVPLPRWISCRLVAYLSASFCNACDRVIIVSPLAEPLLRSFGVTTPIEYIPTGIDEERFGCGDGFRIRKELGIPSSATVLLYVGRIAKEKNISFLLDALEPILAERRRTYLVLVGAGHEIATMKAKAQRLQGCDRILFVGSRPRHEIPDFHAAADVFVTASVTEMHPLSVVEAMMSGLPIVAVGEGGIRFLVKDGEIGFLTPQDKFGFVQAVQTLLDKPHLRMAMGERARTHALKNFTLDAYTAKVEDIYERVLAKGTGRSLTNL